MTNDLLHFAAAFLRHELSNESLIKLGIVEAERFRLLARKFDSFGFSAERAVDCEFWATVFASPRPDASVEGFHTLAATVNPALNPRSHESRRLLRILGSSDYLARKILAHPAYIETLRHDNLSASRAATAISELLARETNLEAISAGLRRIRYTEMLRITARDLEGAPVQETAAEISHLADLCLQGGLQALDVKFGPTPLCTIAMGKLGGYEVNYSSDIDLIFVYDSEARFDTALHEICTRKVAALRSLLSDPTEEGFVFRVDLDLRPDGRVGPLASSLPALLEWYEAHGQEWERIAWVRARPCAGDLALGQQVLQELRPFVYPKTHSYDVIQEALRIKKRIEEEAKRQESDVKRCSGGIREAEFFVQTFQLLYGGRIAALRCTNTAEALSALVANEFLSEALANSLLESYRFLRSLEHRIQMESDRQTHHLPEDRASLLRLARRMNYLDLNSESAIERLLRDFQKVRQRIRGPFATLLEEAKPDRASGVSAWTSACRTQKSFADAIVTAAPEALRERVRPAAERVAERVFAHCPEEARSLGYSPDAARTLALFFAGDHDLAMHIARRPWLLRAFRAKEVRVEDAEAELQASTQDLDDVEAVLDALRITRQDSFVGIGAAQIAGIMTQEEVEHALTETAETILRRASILARRHVQRLTGPPVNAEGAIPFAILGCGKLGAHEMSFHSDLDLVFVYGGEGTTEGGTKPMESQEHFVKVAQRLISHLVTPTGAGRAYAIDTRLRPSGNAGMLVVSYDAFRKYHEQQAQIWEAQALLRTRPVAGDLKFGKRLLALKQEILFAQPPRSDLASEILRMRERMQNELCTSDATHLDLKLDAGGIVDAEFLAQFLALRWGHERADVRQAKTTRALHAANAAQLATGLDEICKAYLWLRQAEALYRLFSGHAHSTLDLASHLTLAVAETLHCGSVAEFEERTRSAMHKIHTAFQQIVV